MTYSLLFFYAVSRSFSDIFIPSGDTIKLKSTENRRETMADLWLAGITAVLLLVYLLYALWKPEDF